MVTEKISSIFDIIRKLPNPVEAGHIIEQVNILVCNLDKIPLDKMASVKKLLEDILELQKQSPTAEPLNMAVTLITEINKLDMEKIAELRKIIKEASKLPLADILNSG